VKVVSGDLVQLSEILSGGSYAAQNDLRQHFGLGKNRNIQLIEVEWPDGTTTIRKDISANQILLVQKGE
jgi:hypothetical protein